MAHTRQSRPDSGLGFQVKCFELFPVGSEAFDQHLVEDGRGAEGEVVPASGFRSSGFGFRVLGFGFRNSGSGFRDSVVGFRVSNLGVRAW